LIDYLTNLKIKDNPARAREILKLERAFGYLPVYGPTIEDMKYGQNLLGHILSRYPGYRWVIEVRDQIITVVNESLAPDWGFRLKERMIDNDGHVIRRFAGELLERYGIKQMRDLNECPRDARGNVVKVA
jgi:hypothetical protein